MLRCTSAGPWRGPVTIYDTNPAPEGNLRFGSVTLSANPTGDIALLIERFNRPFASQSNELFATYRPRGGPGRNLSA